MLIVLALDHARESSHNWPEELPSGPGQSLDLHNCIWLERNLNHCGEPQRMPKAILTIAAAPPSASWEQHKSRFRSQLTI